MDATGFDRGQALRHQRELLEAEAQRLEHIISASCMLRSRIAEVYRSGVSADSAAAMDAVEAHRQQINERFYPCSHAMQVQLGEGYVLDPRFTETYERIEPGLALWVRDAIRANAERAGS